MSPEPEHPSRYFQELQARICASLEELDGRGKFCSDAWSRSGGGGGLTRVLEDGAVLEKAGVNFSDVHGALAEDLARQMPGEGSEFRATGISLVIHPANPMVPTVHANFRFLSRGSKEWFGGGADLTPYYPFREDVIHFHRAWKRICTTHAPLVDYQRLKRWCDEYFYLPHRGEARGVGGIFFDYLEGPRERIMPFIRECSAGFLDAYLPIARRRKDEPFTPEQREFQEIRRGRYVEFNLLYDRGTLFGLKTGGRIESILMTLPPRVQWRYDYQPVPGSREAALADYLKPRDWAEEA
jgi:coproporphyrinogen III oxidase